MVHAPFALLPVAFPENHWKLACEVAPIFNELIDRVSLDGNFLQDSLSRYHFILDVYMIMRRFDSICASYATFYDIIPWMIACYLFFQHLNQIHLLFANYLVAFGMAVSSTSFLLTNVCVQSWNHHER